MKPEIFKNKSKVIIPSALVFLFIAFSFIPPVYINYVRNNWEEILLNKLEFIQSDIQESFTSRGYNLIEQTKYNKSVIKSKLNNSTFYYENKRRTDNDLIVHLYNENFELIFWNYEQISANFNRDYFINYLDQTCFSQFKLTTYLTFSP